MAACTLDKVWPVLPGQADRHGVLVHGAVRGDGGGAGTIVGVGKCVWIGE